MSQKVFVFWDNSNIFVSAKVAAAEREGQEARSQIRIQFDNLLKLAAADREVEFALAVGSVPPELRGVWNRLENAGVKVELFERGSMSEREQAVDQALQVHMLRKTIDYNGTPGIVVLLTGDGKGILDGVGFHADLERMHKKGWGIEVLAWDGSCSHRLKDWTMSVGVYVPLEDFYDSITFRDGFDRVIRQSTPLDFSKRPTVQ